MCACMPAHVQRVTEAPPPFAPTPHTCTPTPQAAHFLTGYLLGVPVVGFSLSIGKEHTDFAEAKLQQRLIERSLSPEEVSARMVCA
jgi:hypothetical protein